MIRSKRPRSIANFRAVDLSRIEARALAHYEDTWAARFVREVEGFYGPTVCQRCHDSGRIRYATVDGPREIDCHHCDRYLLGPDQRVQHREQYFDAAENAYIDIVTYASGRVDYTRLTRTALAARQQPPCYLYPREYLSETYFVERERAKQRAEELLIKHMTVDQRADFSRNRAFDVQGGSTGKTYRIHYQSTSNVHCEGVSYCAVLQNGEPIADQLLAQKLMLTHHEQRFLKIAIRTGGQHYHGGGSVWGRPFIDDDGPLSRTEQLTLLGCCMIVVATLGAICWGAAFLYGWTTGSP